MTDPVEQFFSFVVEHLNQVLHESGPTIRTAAAAIANAIEHDGILMLYGSGHSALIARDGAYRAGGLAPALALDDIAEGDAERTEGLARYIAAHYDLRPENVIAIISHSGINPVPIEMAMIAKAAGLTVIAITSLGHSQLVPSRHSSGKKLFELADIVIDTHGVPGDAAIELPGSTLKSGATSTIMGSAIVQAITVQVGSLLAEHGHEAPVWVSANLPGSEAHNQALMARYRSRLVRFNMAAMPDTNRKPDHK